MTVTLEILELRLSMTSNCKTCGRAYNSAEALQQHLRDSPAHAVTFDCDDCDRAFDTDGALQQHLRDSPAHAVTFDCDDCDRTFDTDGALQQHLRDSPMHTKPTTRSDVYKVWGGQSNLMQSYGLKRHNPRDFEEANAIVDVLAQQMGGMKM
ncbi:hypothetical protein LTR49_027016 [Elasticomyces elasticus]|nr:hypothetical protein LTR49_027016 [Elasticomyces elasticus]